MKARGPSAEILETVAPLVNPNLAADKADLDRMWTHMILFDEHTWTASNSITDPTSLEVVNQLAVKDSHAVDAKALSASLMRNSMASIADSIFAGKGSLIVFNTLNWKRNGAVSIDLINGDEVVDQSTGQVVPVENVPTGKASHHIVPLRIIDNGKSFNRVRFAVRMCRRSVTRSICYATAARSSRQPNRRKRLSSRTTIIVSTWIQPVAQYAASTTSSCGVSSSTAKPLSIRRVPLCFRRR